MSQVKFTDGKLDLVSRRTHRTQLWLCKATINSRKHIFNRKFECFVYIFHIFRVLTGEKVLCYHGQLIYEAKLLKTQLKDRTVKYYIHYAGWSKNWDEWVGESRVLKYNETNVQLQKDVQKKLENSTNKNSKKAAKTPAGVKKS